jgi:hypothetical protein
MLTRASALTGSASTLIEGSFEASNQAGSGERLGEEANGSRLQRAGADALFREGRNEYERRCVPLVTHMGEKVQATHGGHLHIRDDTCRFVQTGRLQKLLGRRECIDQISMRTEKIIGRGTDGCIVVNNCNH